MTKNSLITPIFTSLMIVTAITGYSVAHPTDLTVSAVEVNPEPTPIIITKEVIKEVPQNTSYTYEEAKAYLKVIFGKDWKVALAVAESECNHTRKEWPNCKLSWEKEHSIGWFQINIAQEEGHGKKVHWDKIPGKDLTEKEHWLKNPQNNTLIAKMIFDRSGFEPWSAYTSGAYLQREVNN